MRNKSITIEIKEKNKWKPLKNMKKQIKTNKEQRNKQVTCVFDDNSNKKVWKINKIDGYNWL